MKRCFLVVIDSLGVGEAPDADKYGDLGTILSQMLQMLLVVSIYQLWKS